MGQKILVVEDNELNLKLFCDLLRAHGYAAEPVRDGREAVARARAFAPDLIVMDIQMPHISGLELIEQIKADAELRSTPIMAVTAYAAKGDEERIRDAGAEGYVSKPISLIRFVEAVQALLTAPRAQEAAEAEKPEEPEEPVVRVSRRFEAPPERVFDAWLDRETLGEWLFATPEGEMVRVAVEPWVGGHYEIVERREGEEVLHTGTYQELERPRLLAFTLQVPKYAQDPAHVRIEIAPEGETAATLVLTHRILPDWADQAEMVRQGWEKILAALAQRLREAGAKGDGP